MYNFTLHMHGLGQPIRSALLCTLEKNAVDWKEYNYLINAWRTSTFREKTFRREKLETSKFSLYFSGSFIITRNMGHFAPALVVSG